LTPVGWQDRAGWYLQGLMLDGRRSRSSRWRRGFRPRRHLRPAARRRPAGLGEAIAGYGCIIKPLYVLTFVDDPAYRREMKAMRNLNEVRHDLVRHIFHGRKDVPRRAGRLDRRPLASYSAA
jgi:hypothetical protein